MLHDFLTANRSELIERCRAKVALRGPPLVPSADLGHGIPLFLDQLTEMLPGGSRPDSDNRPSPTTSRSPAEVQIEYGAMRHGHELLRGGFTIDQVVHDYGDLCQAITQLAEEKGAEITVQEFGALNIRLDNAIAGAVTEFTRDAGAGEAALAASTESLRAIVREMRSLHAITHFAARALQQGSAGTRGATSAALSSSVAKMGKLIDRAAFLVD